MNPHKFLTTVVEAMKDESITGIIQVIEDITRICPPSKMQDFKVVKNAPQDYDVIIVPKIKVEYIKLTTTLKADNGVVTDINTRVV